MDNFNILGVTIGIPQVFSGIAALICSIIIYWILEKTNIGRALRATSENREAAQMMGINIEQINILAWVISSASVGIAASLLASYYFVFPDVGAIFGL
jgi:branched-chain amino acid transport system permease protein